MKTRFIVVVALLLAVAAWAASVRRIGQATGTTSQTVVTGGAEKLLVQCGRTGATKVAYRIGSATSAPTAVTTDEWLDFSSSLEAYRIRMPVPGADRIAFIASDGTSSFTCEVYEERP